MKALLEKCPGADSARAAQLTSSKFDQPWSNHPTPMPAVMRALLPPGLLDAQLTSSPDLTHRSNSACVQAVVQAQAMVEQVLQVEFDQSLFDQLRPSSLTSCVLTGPLSLFLLTRDPRGIKDEIIWE